MSISEAMRHDGLAMAIHAVRFQNAVTAGLTETSIYSSTYPYACRAEDI